MFGWLKRKPRVINFVLDVVPSDAAMMILHTEMQMTSAMASSVRNAWNSLTHKPDGLPLVILCSDTELKALSDSDLKSIGLMRIPPTAPSVHVTVGSAPQYVPPPKSIMRQMP